MLPQNQKELSEAMALTYAASAMWNRLFQLIDGNKYLDIPASIKNTKYLNGQPVIQDNTVYGSAFIKTLFEALETQSKQVSHDHSRNRCHSTPKLLFV